MSLWGGAGDDSIQVDASVGRVSIWGEDGAERIGLKTLNTVASVAGGAQDDRFDLSIAVGGTVEVLGGTGSDTFVVGQSAGTLKLRGEAGDDRFVLGKLQANGTWRTTLLAGVLDLDGGDGLDSLLIDESGRTTTATVVIDATTITGIAPGTLGYKGFEALELRLGSGADSISVRNTRADLTTIDVGAGNDTITVEKTSGVVALAGGEGNDRILVRGIDFALAVSGGAGDDQIEVGGVAGTAAIRARLGIDGGVGSDKLSVLNNRVGTANLSMGTVTGLGMTAAVGTPAGVSFQGLETVAITAAAVNPLATQTPTAAA